MRLYTYDDENCRDPSPVPTLKIYQGRVTCSTIIAPLPKYSLSLYIVNGEQAVEGRKKPLSKT